MTKSANRKVAARKTRSAHSKKSSKRSTEARNKNQKTYQKVAAKLRNNVAAETVRDTHWIDAQYDRLSGSRLPDTLARPCRTERSSDARAV